MSPKRAGCNSAKIPRYPNGFFGASEVTVATCIAGFLISQVNSATTISPLVNGVVAASAFTPVAGHFRTRCGYVSMRTISSGCCRPTMSSEPITARKDSERNRPPAVAQILFEVQDTTNGIAGTPTVLYSGSFTTSPAPWCIFAPLTAGFLECSIGNVTVEQQGPIWVTSTPANGSPVVRRLGTTAQGADCTIERTGKLRFYPASTPQAGERIAVSYRTTHRSVARLASASSIAAESNGGVLPGTACWMGSVTIPVPRSSATAKTQPAHSWLFPPAAQRHGRASTRSGMPISRATCGLAMFSPSRQHPRA